MWVFSYATFSENRMITSSMPFHYGNCMGVSICSFLSKTAGVFLFAVFFQNRTNLSSMLTLLLRPHGYLFVLFSSENRMNFSSILFSSENRMNFSSVVFLSGNRMNFSSRLFLSGNRTNFSSVVFLPGTT